MSKTFHIRKRLVQRVLTVDEKDKILKGVGGKDYCLA
jgi:hypothetical protein